MRHNQIIKLISITVTEDAIGNQVEIQTEKEVFANQFYVSSTEFYNAAQTGLKPEKEFEIYSFEYQGEEKLKHEDVIYNIIRTESRGEKCRLVCERIGADIDEPFMAYLSALTIGTITLTPAFNGGMENYIAATTNAADIITAIPFESAATIAIELNGVAMINGTAATWDLGENIVEITVTNGADTIVYTITVTKS